MAAADVTGKWNVTASAPDGREYKMDMDLKSEAGKLTGQMSSPRGSVPLQDLQLSGDQLTYKLPIGDNAYSVKLTVTGDSMKGAWTAPDGTSGATVAARAVATAAASSEGIVGKWKVTSKSANGREHKLTMEIAAEAGKLRGSVIADDGSAAMLDPRLEGDQFLFKLPVDEGTYTVKLTVSGNSMTGSYTSTHGDTGTVAASR